MRLPPLSSRLISRIALAILAFTLLQSHVIAADPPEAAPTSGSGQSMLEWLIESSGWIGAFILVLSIYFVAVVVRSFLELRQSILIPPELVAECDKLIKARDVAGVYRLVKNDDSFFGVVLAAGIPELRYGLAEARDASERVADASTVELERRISMLAVLGTLGPMIGLLGTLKGMISAFSVIAMSETTLRPNEVAGAISEALVLTFEGVLLSVPAIYFFALFRNRIASFTADAVLSADFMLRQIYQITRTKGGAAVPTESASAGSSDTLV